MSAIPNDSNIINIHDKKNPPPLGHTREHRMIRLTPVHTKLLNRLTELSKPSSREFLKAIERLFECDIPNHSPMSNKSRRLLHIDFLLKITMKKQILHIQLI